MREDTISSKQQFSVTPLMRIHTFGNFSIERLVWSESAIGQPPRYEPLARSAWKGRRTAQTLLKILLCSPDRRASKEVIREAIWSDEQAESRDTARALQVADSTLRSVLGLPDGSSLLLTTEGTDGGGYQLAEQRRLWVDVDAFEVAIKQASKETRREQALTSWEAAYQWTQGVFLPDDVFSEWSQVRRRRIEGNRRLCVHRLADLYLQEQREDEAEVVLRTFWAENLTDEDCLRRLMHLLTQQGREEEALLLYEQTRQALEEDGVLPSSRTNEVAEHIRRKSSTQEQALFPVEKTAPHAFENSGSQNVMQPMYLHMARPTPFESRESAQLTQGASYLGQLLSEGWSSEEILESVKVVLRGIEAMPPTMRQNVLWSNICMLSGSIPFFTSTSISDDEQIKLSSTLSESIIFSWKQFLFASTAQMLALGQTQLALIQQAHPLLHPTVRPYLYTGAYGLIGMALHFQERDVEALQVHQNGYLAASSTGDAWYVVQSLICQGDCYNALRQYDFAIKMIQEALWIINAPMNDAQLCAKAHLLSCWADNAMMLDDYKTAQEKLAASEEYLDQISLNEEFDRAGWLLLAGKYALKTENYLIALRNFEHALVELPEQWTLRRAMTALGLAKAYARIKERDKSLEVAQNLTPMIQTINAKLTNRWFTEYLRYDLLALFPTDLHVRTFISNAYQQHPQLRTIG